MDVVYIYRQSKWNDNELRFSLRSIEKYLPHRRVYIVGFFPGWVRNAIHIRARDSYGHKIKNAISKIREVCRDPELSDKFVLMNDDFFLLRHFREILPYTLGQLGVNVSDHKTKQGYYYTAMCETLKLLNTAGFDRPASYEVHYPMILDKRKFLELTDSISWEGMGYLFRSVYGNTYSIGVVPRRDTKCYNLSDLEDLGRGDMISITDRLAHFAQMQKFLYERFPEPSKYEDPESSPGKLP